MCWLSDFNRKTSYTVLAPPHVLAGSTGVGSAGIINGFLYMAFHGCSRSPTPMTLQFKPCLFGSRVLECSFCTPSLLVLIKALKRTEPTVFQPKNDTFICIKTHEGSGAKFVK